MVVCFVSSLSHALSLLAAQAYSISWVSHSVDTMHNQAVSDCVARGICLQTVAGAHCCCCQRLFCCYAGSYVCLVCVCVHMCGVRFQQRSYCVCQQLLAVVASGTIALCALMILIARARVFGCLQLIDLAGLPGLTRHTQHTVGTLSFLLMRSPLYFCARMVRTRGYSCMYPLAH